MPKDLRFHYSPLEDRIAAAVSGAQGGAVVLWLSRRMTGKFLDALAEFMSRTSPGVASAPGHAAEVLGFEHEHAIVQAGGEGAFRPVPSKLKIEPAPRLVDTVNLSRLQTGQARLVLRAREQQIALDLPREALHLVYRQLRGLAEHAGWRLELKVPWQSSGGGASTAVH